MLGSWLSRRTSEFLGVAFFATALIWLIALTTYDSSDPVWFFSAGGPDAPSNFAGRVGAFLAELSYQLLGYAAYVIPAVVATIGWHAFWCRRVDAAYTKVVGALLLVACLASFLTLAFGTVSLSGTTMQAGGTAGAWLAGGLAEYLNRTGSIIFILTALFLAIILTTQFSFGRVFAATCALLARSATAMAVVLRDRRAERQRARQRQQILKKHSDKAPTETEAKADALAKALARAPVKPERAAPPPKKASRKTPTPSIRHDPPDWAAAPLPLTEPVSKAPAERRSGEFSHPPAALLDAPRTEQKIDERELMDGARLLGEKCREFNVAGDVVQIHPGPVVTTYEFKPDAGVKYSKITSLAEDLCLAMQAESVLIDRIPGKSTVGIQIPNQAREVISLRELLESEVYRRSTSKLSLTLGKTIHGEPFITDLSSMPHLLVAGSTGAGKSVAINSMITSILYRATPDDVRMIMIDPKRLELGMYEDIPHLLTPVVVDPKLASNALRWAVREMEERYKHLAAHGVRNIDQYNRNARQAAEEQAGGRSAASDADPEEIAKPLPYIVVIIDELADLMMVASHEVEESIARLAQMARAVGIHLILATQRPSVDVITGLIKANLPARISFRVSSKTDSRTILDANGAQQLLGNGDMLYLPPASSRLIRLHGPYISEQESARLASFLRKQGSPIYDDTITSEEKTVDAVEFDRDELYDEAARIIVSNGQASISYLQRRMRVGFSRAARLVDMMEADGLVSAGGGGKAREVLVGKDYFEEVDAQVR
ncbi:MAG: DNA translocase FtsK 4TM domain-containing protein [Vicinamibacterales bacterium]|jgi:S-DNA-T family DNA segregation ATPase FtsK/SpoIIIE|nr:cell division protein FtsK [Acidobacteriota bacterium]MDP7671988.1 DNA translocase FtsK 4TM domain-containing protein [Vicinamibacterales bacterium]HJO37204.1 DNA translocase FtsK 4TM domain-containing protein [Vicinamibacterales bacterium]